MSARPIPTQLPSTITELEQFEWVKPTLTLNDHVQIVFKKLWDHQELGPKFRALLDATGDDETVEGSMATDNVFAAQMVRDYAMQYGPQEVVAKPTGEKVKAHAIVRALKVVMNRYNMSRKIRARTLGGTVVPAEENGE